MEVFLSTQSWRVLRIWASANKTSTIHAIITSLIGINGLLKRDYELSNNLLLVVSAGYFITDIIHNDLKYDMIFHHILGILMAYIGTQYYIMSSIMCKGILVEISTPFLNKYFETKSKFWGLLFAISFFICRIVWLPIIFKDFLKENPDQSVKMLCFTFILLNYYWFFKIMSKIIQK